MYHRSALPPPPAAPPPARPSLPPMLGPDGLPGGNPGALFRLLIVCLLFALNFFALVGVLLRRNGPSSSSSFSRSKPALCAHRFSYGLLCLLLNAYLGTWIPYLLSSFLHSTVWPLLEVRTHCAIQHLATTQVSTALLAILCLQKIFETFASRRAKLLCTVIFFTWIFPQSLYTVISELISSSGEADNEMAAAADSLYFLDAGDSHGKQSTFQSGTDHHHHLHHFDIHQQQQKQQQQLFGQGVLFCLHRLNYSVISSMTWHYVVLVVPLTSVFIICAGSKQFAKNSVFGSLPHVNCRCSSDIVTTFVLASNFSWLLLFRPLLTLLALLQQQQNIGVDGSSSSSPEHSAHLNNISSANSANLSNSSSSSESLPLDLCAHLLLFLLAAVLPFSAQFGLLVCCNSSREEEDEEVEDDVGALEFDAETSPAQLQTASAAALKSQILLSAAVAVQQQQQQHQHHHQLTAAPRPAF